LDVDEVLTRHGERAVLDRRSRAFAAECNAEMQEELLHTLLAALTDSRTDLSVLAERLGADEAFLRQLFNGETDINLNELRMIASALNVVIQYRVTPAPVEWYRREQDRLAAKASRRVGQNLFTRSKHDMIKALLRSKDGDGVHV
jgi:DNA-binding transcriptional regulator YdaS (Cro superfamily)